MGSYIDKAMNFIFFRDCITLNQLIVKIFQIFLFVHFFGLSAQTCEYDDYYPLVRNAYLNYNKKDYKKARENLKLAFSKTNHPFGMDLHLAMQTSRRLEDDNWSRDIAIKLAKGGVPLRYFVKYKKFSWFNDFKTNFEKFKAYYEVNYNEDLKYKLLDLIERDRMANAKFHDWRTKKIELTLEELIDMDKKISNDFKNILSDYGYPTERLMGYNYVRRKNNVERFYTVVLVRHIYQSGSFVLKNSLDDVICSGGLHPRDKEPMLQVQNSFEKEGIEHAMKMKYERYRGKSE